MILAKYCNLVYLNIFLFIMFFLLFSLLFYCFFAIFFSLVAKDTMHTLSFSPFSVR